MGWLVVFMALVFVAGVVVGWGYAKAAEPFVWSRDRKALHTLGRSWK